MATVSTILIVDDQWVGREALTDLLLSPDYNLAYALTGAEALELAARLDPDLILLDVMLPGMDGYAVCRQIRAMPRLAEIPIIMITALDEHQARLQGLEAGADDFISKPFDRHELRTRVKTITRLNRYRRLQEERAALHIAHAELLAAYDATIEGWVHALDLRDKETEGHSLRVTHLTVELATRLGAFSTEALTHIRRGALLHDIGKLGIPDAILLKPGKLTVAEFDVLRHHPQYAYDMLAPIAYLRPALNIPHCHHEKWDGSGYPRGLAGETIPLEARLFALVDVWDALRSDRPYRVAWPIDITLAHIHGLTGSHFDPELVPFFLNYIEQVSNC